MLLPLTPAGTHDSILGKRADVFHVLKVLIVRVDGNFIEDLWGNFLCA